MSKSPELSPSDWEFVTKFGALVSQNPFLEPISEPIQDQKAATNKLGQLGRLFWQDRDFSSRSMEVLGKLASYSATAIVQLAPERQRAYFDFVLLSLYGEFAPALDLLIEKQLRTQEKTIKLDFAEEFFARTHAFKVPQNLAVKFLECSFQFRRAFIFISRALMGNSVSMMRMRQRLWENLFTHDMKNYFNHLVGRMNTFSLLLLGETGTGKSAAAKAIGLSGYIRYQTATKNFSENFNNLFISVNVSEFSEGLLESELFGHRKGAFTGATNHSRGLLGQCSDFSTVFFDEVAEASEAIQVKLLRVLQDRSFFPVGSREEMKFPGRIVAATNQDIAIRRSTKRLRDDFFYRLSTDVITMPSLRQRLAEDRSEIKILLRYLVRKFMGGDVESVYVASLKSCESLIDQNYPWPGNVRELEQCVKRVIMQGEYVGDTYVAQSAAKLPGDVAFFERAGSADDLLENYCKALYSQFGTYEAVASRSQLDRRTVKKYIHRQDT